MADTMDKTLEAVTALSAGVNVQLRKLDKHGKKIEARDDKVAEHQRKINAANDKLKAHVNKINKAVKDNERQQKQIEVNIRQLRKHQKMIKELAEEQGTATRDIAVRGLSNAKNKNTDIAGHLHNSKHQFKSLNETSAEQNNSIATEGQAAARLENTQVILKAEVQRQKENITAQETNISKDQKKVAGIEEDDKAMEENILKMMVVIGVGLIGVMSFTCIKTAKMKKILDEAEG